MPTRMASPATIGTVTLDYPPTEPALAVTSHTNGTLTTAIFDNVDVRNSVSQ